MLSHHLFSPQHSLSVHSKPPICLPSDREVSLHCQCYSPIEWSRGLLQLTARLVLEESNSVSQINWRGCAVAQEPQKAERKHRLFCSIHYNQVESVTPTRYSTYITKPSCLTRAPFSALLVCVPACCFHCHITVLCSPQCPTLVWSSVQ